MGTSAPGAVPRGCCACYRGHSAAVPRLVEWETGRIGVNMAAPDIPTEMLDSLTEWVTVMLFSWALRTKLLKYGKGETIVVLGNVTRKPY